MKSVSAKRYYITGTGKLQHCATTLITAFGNKYYEECLSLLQITSLEPMRTRGDLIELFKMCFLVKMLLTFGINFRKISLIAVHAILYIKLFVDIVIHNLSL